MTRTKRTIGQTYGVKLPTALPEVGKLNLAETKLKFSTTEYADVKTAMSIYAASRKPQLFFEGWLVIGNALELAETKATKYAKGVITSRGEYGQAIEKFLRLTGFKFINKGERWALRQIMTYKADVIEWRDSLLGSDREHLNNPIDIWERFNKDDRKPREGGRQRPKRMRHKEQNNLLDQLEALGALVESLKDRLSMAETTIHEIAPQLTAERASDISPATLRVIYPHLSDDVQDALHDRLE